MQDAFPRLLKGEAWKLVVCAMAAGLAVGHLCRPEQVDNEFIVLMLLAVSPWLLPFLAQHVTSVEAFGTKLELNRLQRKIDDLIVLSIGDKLLTHLRKLDQPGGYGSFFVGTALPRELEQLENLGYIRFQGDLTGLDDFQNKLNWKNGDNLSDYVALTDAGRLFLKLRRESEESRAQRSVG